MLRVPMSKITYIHYLRGVAAFFIVAIHFNLFTSKETISGRIFHQFLSEWTAIFVLISGFLFQHLVHKYNPKKFYINKLKNVVLPYVIISLPVIMIFALKLKSDHPWLDLNELYSHSAIYITLFFYTTGAQMAPLWFIPVLILIFLTSKPLSILANSQVWLGVFAFISLFVVIFTSRPEHNLNPFLAYFHFLPVYVIGMYIYSKRNYLINKKHEKSFLFMYLSFFVLCIVFDLNASFSIISKIPLFLYLCIVLDREINNKKIALGLSILADVSFSIYFIHGVFIGMVRRTINSIANYFNHQISSIEGIFLALLVTIVIITMITIFCLLVKKATSHSRMLIGS
jgi:surface polysaccharide O-acyltransferase-like enzyme